MAPQAFGHLPWRSLFWFGWLFLPTANPTWFGHGQSVLFGWERRPECLVWEQELCAENWSRLLLI